MQIKYKLLGDGTDKSPYTWDLPTATFLKIIDDKKLIALLEVPDDYCTDGKLDDAKIKKMYDYSNLELAQLEKQFGKSARQNAESIQTKNFSENEIK